MSKMEDIHLLKSQVADIKGMFKSLVEREVKYALETYQAKKSSSLIKCDKSDSACAGKDFRLRRSSTMILRKKRQRGRPKKSSDFEICDSLEESIAKENKYTCQYCSAKFNKAYYYKQHILTHKPELYKSFSCPLCERKYNSHKALQHHMTWHTSSDSLKCLPCKRIFKTLKSLDDHNKNIHLKGLPQDIYTQQRTKEDESVKSRKTMKCDCCPEVFNNLTLFNIHLREHLSKLGSIYFSCPLCDKEYSSAIGLFTHQGSHSDAENYQCSVCNENFINLYLLTIHYNKTHKNMPEKLIEILKKAIKSRETRKNNVRRVSYTCRQCKKVFRNIISFSNHLLSHKEEVAFNCPLCEGKFDSASKLLLHGRMNHCTTQNYECSDCENHFDSLDYLILHFNKTHNVVPLNVLEILEKSVESRQKEKNARKRRYYKCKYCGEDIQGKRQYDSHMISHEKESSGHLSSFEYTCPFCERKYEKMFSLFQHLRSHPPQSELNCLVCNETFDTVDNLTVHCHKEHTRISEYMLKMLVEAVAHRKHDFSHTEKFNCDQCKRCFTDYKLFCDHKIKHLQESVLGPLVSFPCPTCEQEYDTIWRLIIHLTDHQNFATTECQKCEEIFENLPLLTVHYYEQHFKASELVSQFVQNIVRNSLGLGARPEYQKVRPLICNYCGIKYAYQRDLLNHKYLVHLENTFCCEFCGKQFKRADSLNKHKLTHSESHKKSRVNCKECGKTFASASYQNHYIALHTNEKPYKCNICGKGYSSAPALHMHKMTVCEKHKAKKSTCMNCQKTFDNYLLRFYHTQNTHKYGNTEELVCHLCQKSFDKSVHLYFHNKTRHEPKDRGKEETNHECNVCGTPRGNEKALFDHWLIHNTEKTFECEVCKIKFKQRCGFYQHKKLKHKNDQRLKLKTDFLMLRKLKQKFKAHIMTSVKSVSSGQHEIYSETLNDALSVLQNNCPLKDPTEILLDLNSTLVGTDENKGAPDPTVWKNLLKDHVQSGAHYIDFSRANVPEESVNLQISPAVSSSNNCYQNLEKNINSENTEEYVATPEQPTDVNYNDITINEQLVEPEEDFMNFDLTSLDCTYGMLDDVCDSSLNLYDVKPVIINNNEEFPEDPFPKKLIIQLQKLKYYECTVCEIVLYTFEHYKQHTNSRSHRWAMKERLNTATAIKTENENKNKECAVKKKVAIGKSQSGRKQKSNCKPTKQPSQPCLRFYGEFLPQDQKSGDISKYGGDNAFYCKICDSSFICDNSFQAHMISEHKNLDYDKIETSRKKKQVRLNKLYICSVCGETAMTYKLYKSHLLSHKNFKYKCVVCKELLDSRSDLENHYAVTHKNEMPFQCKECLEEFPTKFRFEQHKVLTHSQPPEISSVFIDGQLTCEVCGKKYSEIGTLISHLKIHDQNAEKQIFCEVCGVSFLKEFSLKTHMRIHTGDKPYRCDQCDKSFISSRSLRDHINKIHLQKKQMCEICGKSFSKRHKLNVHQRLHTGEKPYKCNQCDKSFISSTHLKEHSNRIHLGIKHVCDTCGKMFSDMRNLRKHKKIHTGIKTSCCSFCGKTFSAPSDVKRHINSVHYKLTPSEPSKPKPKPFGCSVCSEQFHTQVALDKHFELHNPTRPFPCELCSCRFNFNSNLVLHRKNVHEKQRIDYWTKGRKAKKLMKVSGNQLNENKILPVIS